MDICEDCDGDGECYYCGGTGSKKDSNPHPDPWDIGDDGSVDCPICDGDGKCPTCGGIGSV